MGSGDLNADVAAGGLLPASSVRGIEARSPQQDAEGKRRRRLAPEASRSEPADLEDTSHDGTGQHHQIDRLA
jgi:hypothetical protein